MKKIILVAMLIVLQACNSTQTRSTSGPSSSESGYERVGNSYVHGATGYRFNSYVGNWRRFKPPYTAPGSREARVSYVYRGAVLAAYMMPYRYSDKRGLKEFKAARIASERVLSHGKANVIGFLRVQLNRGPVIGLIKGITYESKGRRHQFYIIVIPVDNGLLKIRVIHGYGNNRDYLNNIEDFIQKLTGLRVISKYTVI